MKLDLFPYLSHLFAYRLTFLVNLGYVISGICYAIIFLKLKKSKDGAFRTHMLRFFGASMIGAFLMSFYHPLYNFWLIPVAKILTFLPLVRLTWYIIDEFWMTKTQ